MSTNKECVVWLMPPPDMLPSFATLIERLSARFGTPRFEPHVTLASTSTMTEAAVVEQMKEMARRLAPVPVILEDAGYTDTYFRCLFLRAQKTEPLLAAHRLACERLGQAPTADFMPHLSLVYGEIETNRKVQAIEEEIAGRFPPAFIADRLLLCVPDGSPDTWKTVGPFLLTGAPDPA